MHLLFVVIKKEVKMFTFQEGVLESLINKISKHCLILSTNSHFLKRTAFPFFHTFNFYLFSKCFISSMCTFQAPSHNLKQKRNYLRCKEKLLKNHPIKVSHRSYLFQFLMSKTLVRNFLSSILLSNMNTNHITEILTPFWKFQILFLVCWISTRYIQKLRSF